MFKTYIRIAWRNLVRHPLYSFINVIGLAGGIAFTLLIGAYVWGELQFNRDLKHANRQYIIQTRWKDPNMGYAIACPGPLAKTLKEEYPSLVANYYRFDAITTNVSEGDKVFREGLQLGDSTLLDMYGFGLLFGDSRTALLQPFSVVITEDLALKFFGKTSVLGKSLTLENFSGLKHDFMISGVMRNLPPNSITQLNSDNQNHLYLPLSSAGFFGRPIDSWSNANIIGYVELQQGVNVGELQRPLQELIRKHAPANMAANLTPYLVPLDHYNLERDNNRVLRMLYTVSLIASFILLMAILNFINISISLSTSRIKEVGLRKAFGGRRQQLIIQFFIESMVLVGLSSVLAFGIYDFINPFLSRILGRPIPLLSSFPLMAIGSMLILIVVFIGGLAGFYPALILSAVKAVDSLKGKLKSVKEQILLRKTLSGVQFFIASAVLTGAVIITKQVAFLFDSDLGYEKEFVVSAQVPRDWTARGVKHIQMVRNEFASIPEVENVSVSWQMLNGWDIGKLPIFLKGQDSTQALATQSLVADENYAKTFKIPMMAGRFFAGAADTLTIVLNETAARAMGWLDVQEAIGKQVILPDQHVVTVIGVTRDFHFGPMQEKIQPISFLPVNLNNVYRYLSFRLKPGRVGASLKALQRKWAELLPGSAFEYSFMDEALAQLYQSEIRLKKASQLATVLALIIVLLGLVGLISLSVRKRYREFGIRKVLGASSFNIVVLYLKEFLPVCIAGGTLSIPIAWYCMRGWLNDYAYRIPLTPWPFIGSVLILCLIAILIIFLQIVKASIISPVEILRTE
ncbi:MAG: ABC transporter permease [Flavisolibacter sp.]